MTREHGPPAEQPPLPLARSALALTRCVLKTAALLGQRQLRQPIEHVGDIVHFADGSTARVYRETRVLQQQTPDPTVLIVAFRLRWLRGRGHAVFRAESLLNTPLFAGFPGFVSKLWVAHDENGVYRGIYQWDGAEAATAYVRVLWWVLALVSVRGSIHYVVLPGLRRDDVLSNPGVADALGRGDTGMVAYHAGRATNQRIVARILVTDSTQR